MSRFWMNLKKMDAFVKGLDKPYEVQVGIFGDKNPRGAGLQKSKGKLRAKYASSNDSLTNADLGAIHEFGSFSRHIPSRSFLRMPINVKTPEIIKEASQGAAKMISEGKLMMVMQRLGIAAENAIQMAFASRGFGTWKADSAATQRRKGSSSPLIDTAQLRRSIASRVVPA
jgi:phage gpG-like protein